MMITEAPPRNASSAAVLTQALAWFDTGSGAALVTVMRTWSSASARPGSLLAVNGAGDSLGSVSGGAVDAQAVTAAVQAIADGTPRGLSLHVGDSDAQRVGLPCGGVIELRIEPLVANAAAGGAPPPAAAPRATALPDLLREVLQAIDERRGVVLCTRLGDASRMLIRTEGDPADTELAVAALRAAAVDSTGIAEIEREPVLFQVFNPPLRLFIVGAVHIAQALAAAAALVGFEVTVIDPRPGFATPARFPGVHCVGEAADLALRMARLDRRSAVVTLSHDASVDDPALVKALNSKAFYVGALGSRKTHKARLKRLTEEARLPERLTARLHGPAGFPIGAIGPAEIAASIVAEVIADLRGQVSRTTALMATEKASSF